MYIYIYVYIHAYTRMSMYTRDSKSLYFWFFLSVCLWCTCLASTRSEKPCYSPWVFSVSPGRGYKLLVGGDWNMDFMNFHISVIIYWLIFFMGVDFTTNQFSFLIYPQQIGHRINRRPWFNGIQWLVGGLEHGFYFPIQLGMSSSQLTNSYFSEG